MNNYITIYNEDYDIYFNNCRFKLEFDNNFTRNLETNYIHIEESEKFIITLRYSINCYESMGYKFYKFNQMTINLINDRCNLTYDFYMNLPMSMVERQINFNIAKNPHLINTLDRTKNHPLLRNFSYKPFNN